MRRWRWFRLSIATGNFFKSQLGLPSPFDKVRETPLSHSFCQHVVITQETLVVTDARSDTRVSDNLAVRDLAVVAYLGVPLKLPNGSVIGSLCAIDGKPRDWSADDIATLSDLASLVMDQIALRGEIVQRREAERQQKLLISELHHRVKNTLAVVQSIIFLSLKTAGSLAQFGDSIRARIMSLANTHTLLIDQQWVSTSLNDLLTTELALHNQESRIALDGPNVSLPSDIAVSLGMCIHELMTNASKYGALSVPNGNIEISWKIEEFDTGTELVLHWVEIGGPPVSAPQHKGFGSLLLDRLINQQS